MYLCNEDSNLVKYYINYSTQEMCRIQIVSNFADNNNNNNMVNRETILV